MVNATLGSVIEETPMEVVASSPVKLPMPILRKRLARLAAVQAWYACEMDREKQLKVETLLDDIQEHYLEQRIKPDPKFLETLLKGAIDQKEGADALISKGLNKDWTIAKLGPILRNILRLAIYELTEMRHIPYKVTISEYVLLTQRFFDRDEAKFVNGLLDNLYKETIAKQ